MFTSTFRYVVVNDCEKVLFSMLKHAYNITDCMVFLLLILFSGNFLFLLQNVGDCITQKLYIDEGRNLQNIIVAIIDTMTDNSDSKYSVVFFIFLHNFYFRFLV